MAKAVKKTSKKKVATKTVAQKGAELKASFEKELAKVKENAKKKALATVEMMMATREKLIEEAIGEAAKKFEKMFGLGNSKKAAAPAKTSKPAKKTAKKKVVKKAAKKK